MDDAEDLVIHHKNHLGPQLSEVCVFAHIVLYLAKYSCRYQIHVWPSLSEHAYFRAICFICYWSIFLYLAIKGGLI